MEPLSIAGSIVGLLAAGAQLVPKFYNLASAFGGATEDAKAAAFELSDLEIVLTQLQQYLNGAAYASTQRLHLISLEHVKATLTQCVKTYSQLNSALLAIRVDCGLKPLDRAIWLLRKDEVAHLVTRLQNHKSTFGLILGILQCASLREAECKVDRLCTMVNAVLQSNRELAMRLRDMDNIGREADVKSSVVEDEVISLLIDPDVVHYEDRLETPAISVRSSIISQRPSTYVPNTSTQTKHHSFSGRAFEELLHRSRVYRHAAKRLSRFSTDERSIQVHSFCSTVTLGEVSNLAFCALPVYANEISNSKCYTFGLHARLTRGEEDEEKGIWWQVAKLKATPLPRKTIQRQTRLGALTPTESLRTHSSASNRSIRMSHVVICNANSTGISHIYGQLPLATLQCQRFLNEKARDIKSQFTVANTVSTLRTLQGHFGTAWKCRNKIQWSGYTVQNNRILLSRYCSIYRNAYEPFSDRRPLASQGPKYRLLGSKIPRQARHLLLHIIDILGEFSDDSDFGTPNFIASHHSGTETLPQNILPADEADAMIFLIENRDKFMFGVSNGAD